MPRDFLPSACQTCLFTVQLRDLSASLVVYLMQRVALRPFILLLALLQFISAQPVSRGPDVGATIPRFSSADQNGVLQSLDRITGPKGAMIVFFRSADW